MTTANPQPNLSSRPPVDAVGPIAWVRKNLFGSAFDAAITVLCAAAIAWGLANFLPWAFGAAEWSVLFANWKLFFAGTYPNELLWRPWLLLELLAAAGGLTWGWLEPRSPLLGRSARVGFGVLAALAVGLAVPLAAANPDNPSAAIVTSALLLGTLLAAAAGTAAGQQLGRRYPDGRAWLPLGWLGIFFVGLWLLLGGLGLESVAIDNLSGAILTLLAAAVSIVLSFPLGLLLALGRRSELPVVRSLSVAYIEVVRGLPLVGILFMAQVMLPLVLPSGLRLDRVVRAIAGLTLFNAAYLAENFRGGLQAVPRGQYEAARALGLNAPLVMVLVVFPQALKIAIPTIVGQVISLFKDTSLLAIAGLAELLGTAQSILANPKFIGRDVEVYLFVALLYWACCSAMAKISRRLE